MVAGSRQKRESRGEQDPKIQVWRENNSQPGVYYKPGPDIQIAASVCEGGLRRVSTGLFHCKLRGSAAQVSVQAGDVLGIELPPTEEDEFVLWFTRPINRGAITYLFDGQLPTTVELSNRTHIKVHEQPQIKITLSGLVDIPGIISYILQLIISIQGVSLLHFLSNYWVGYLVVETLKRMPQWSPDLFQP